MKGKIGVVNDNDFNSNQTPTKPSTSKRSIPTELHLQESGLSHLEASQPSTLLNHKHQIPNFTWHMELNWPKSSMAYLHYTFFTLPQHRVEQNMTKLTSLSTSSKNSAILQKLSFSIASQKITINC